MTCPGVPSGRWRSWDPDLLVPPISQEPRASAWVSIRVKGVGKAGWSLGKRWEGGPQPPPSERTHPTALRIVDEVRSIRFNQEQEEELMHKHLSWRMSLESKSSMDTREMTCQQDLITALINREKVQLPGFTFLLNQCSLGHPTPSSRCLISQSFYLFLNLARPLNSQAPQQPPPIRLRSNLSFSGRLRPSCRAPPTGPSQYSFTWWT